MQIKNILYSALGTAVLLSVPLIGKWSWTSSDFVIAGIIIFGAGVLLSFVLSSKHKYKIAIAGAIAILFVWLWVELAVGLFTNWGS